MDSPWAELLPANTDHARLVLVIARALGAYHRSPRLRHRVDTTPTVTGPRAIMVGFFRLCIADGVFEPHIPAHMRHPLPNHLLDPALLALESSQPKRYAARARPLVLRPRVAITDTPGNTNDGSLASEDLPRMLAACATPAERSFLTLIRTTGLRTGILTQTGGCHRPRPVRWRACVLFRVVEPSHRSATQM